MLEWVECWGSAGVGVLGFVAAKKVQSPFQNPCKTTSCDGLGISRILGGFWTRNSPLFVGTLVARTFFEVLGLRRRLRRQYQDGRSRKLLVTIFYHLTHHQRISSGASATRKLLVHPIPATRLVGGDDNPFASPFLPKPAGADQGPSHCHRMPRASMNGMLHDLHKKTRRGQPIHFGNQHKRESVRDFEAQQAQHWEIQHK